MHGWKTFCLKVWKDDDNQNHNHNKCRECKSSRRSHQMGMTKFHYSILAIGGDGMRNLIFRIDYLGLCMCIYVSWLGIMEYHKIYVPSTLEKT